MSDLMASVAVAAQHPGVSLVSMSWGFSETQAVIATDEAMYDSYFAAPGVTFMASTGDYGAGDLEYPASSPNVVAVGGTSLIVNADNSYDSEDGWGYHSASTGAFIGSGGGISQYEAEPAYQLGVQTTGYRTTPDVSFVADPGTGAQVADPYNLDPSNPWTTVGGTSLSAPCWGGLIALVNQGRVAARQPALTAPVQRKLSKLFMTCRRVITTSSPAATTATCRPRLQPCYRARNACGQCAGSGSSRRQLPHQRPGCPASASLTLDPDYSGGGSGNGVNAFAALSVSSGQSIEERLPTVQALPQGVGASLRFKS